LRDIAHSVQPPTQMFCPLLRVQDSDHLWF